MTTVRDTIIHTNGQGDHHEPTVDDLVADMLDVGAVDESPPVGNGDLISPLVERFSDIPENELEMALLNDVDAIAELDSAEFSLFCRHFPSLTKRFIFDELRPAVKAIQKRHDDSEQERESARITWTHYVNAAEALGYSFRLNELSSQVEINGEQINDVAESILLSRLHEWGLTQVDVARRAFVTRAAEKRYHPVIEYLDGLAWDGDDHIARLATYFPDVHDPITYADGTKRSVFHAFLRRWLIGAITKAYDSHQTQNAMLILEGAQGKGKSYFAKWICPLPRLHIEGPVKPDDKDFLGNLASRMIWEVGELGATIRKADREALKGFLTTQEVTYRPPYGRYTVTKPALASCIGTVNLESGFLNDPTGNRRFWPLTLSTINWEYSQNVDVDQLWAQAYALYHAGESFALCPVETDTHAQLCELYEIEDPYIDRVLTMFDIDPDESSWRMSADDIADVLITYGGVRDSTSKIRLKLPNTMQRLGVEKTLIRMDAGRDPKTGKRKQRSRHLYVGIKPLPKYTNG